ncbi:MAG: SigE family RNA polymerase sigma factor [Pseudonocardiales bacterium]
MNEAEARQEFADFVRVHWSSLMSIGVAVSGSRQEAEDLVQTALTSTYARWQTIRPGEALAYLRRSILNAHITSWRRHRGAELTVGEPVRQSTHDTMATVDDRLSLMPSVQALPRRQRAVVVLRYLCDLSDDEIASTLGTTTSTVRSQAVRGLATLRSTHPGREAAPHPTVSSRRTS